MKTSPIHQLIYDTLEHIKHNMKIVEVHNLEIKRIQEEYQNVVTYDMRFYYSDGFWDGFMFSAVLMTSVMSGVIYFVR